MVDGSENRPLNAVSVLEFVDQRDRELLGHASPQLRVAIERIAETHENVVESDLRPPRPHRVETLSNPCVRSRYNDVFRYFLRYRRQRFDSLEQCVFRAVCAAILEAFLGDARLAKARENRVAELRGAPGVDPTLKHSGIAIKVTGE